jgi:hypothetical protein
VKLLAVAAALLSAGAFAESLNLSGPVIENESPRNMIIEARFGAYLPLIDRAVPKSPGPYETTFGNSPMLLGELEIERQFFQKFGSLAGGLSAGYAEKFSHATLADGTPTDEATSIRVLPMKALAIYRFDWLNIKYGIPLVPFVKVGINVTYWWTSKGAATGTAEGVAGVGWSYGPVVMGGLAFVLDSLDPRLARDFDTGIGVNHTYLFGEFNFAEVNDFGRKTVNGLPYALDLSGRFAMVGLAFEY